MSVEATLRLAFNDNKSAQNFSGWLYLTGYESKSLFLNTVAVHLSSHGDRVVVMEEVFRRRGKILEDCVADDY
jgi:aspartate 1-decarboxylase